MELASVTERTCLIDPAGHRAEQIIEHRTDPLTGAVASINGALGEKAKSFLGAADLDLLNELQETSKASCPFCNAAEKGTRYLPEQVPEGQLRVGAALAMPNLFSKCGFDSVVIVDPSRHVLFPSMLSKEALADAIRVSAELVRRARGEKGEEAGDADQHVRRKFRQLVRMFAEKAIIIDNIVYPIEAHAALDAPLGRSRFVTTKIVFVLTRQQLKNRADTVLRPIAIGLLTFCRAVVAHILENRAGYLPQRQRVIDHSRG